MNTFRKKKWVHEINLERRQYGEYHTLMPQLRQDEKRFYIYFRMTSETFDELLDLIKDDIKKNRIRIIVNRFPLRNDCPLP